MLHGVVPYACVRGLNPLVVVLGVYPVVAVVVVVAPAESAALLGSQERSTSLIYENSVLAQQRKKSGDSYHIVVAPIMVVGVYYLSHPCQTNSELANTRHASLPPVLLLGG